MTLQLAHLIYQHWFVTCILLLAICAPIWTAGIFVVALVKNLRKPREK